MKHRSAPQVDLKDFTARSYQVELFEFARQSNTLVCLNTGSGKTFIAVMLITELSESVRLSFAAGGKRTFFVVPKVPLVRQQAAVIREYTDLSVGEYVGANGVDLWRQERWEGEFETNQVLVMTAQILHDILHHGFLKIAQINLIVFDECHHTTKNNPYAQIMRLFDICPLELQPRILGLSASLINDHVTNAIELDRKISELERMLHCTARTVLDFNEVEMWSTKPLESIETYVSLDDELGQDGTDNAKGGESKGLALYSQVHHVLTSALEFIQGFGDGECDVAAKSPQPPVLLDYAEGKRLLKYTLSPPKPVAARHLTVTSPAVKEASKLARCTLLEALNILADLGVWCTGCVSKNQAAALEKRDKERQNDEGSSRLLLLASTHLRLVSELVDRAADQVQCLDELLALGTPKVKKLIDVLHSFKPDVDFEITSAAVANAPVPASRPPDDPGSDFSDSDSFDSSDSETSSGTSDEQDAAGGAFVARRRMPAALLATDPNGAANEGDHVTTQELSICGIVFVVRRHAAFALHKFIEQLCIWDENLCFIRSGYVVGHGDTSVASRDARMGVHRQEEALKQFRQRDASRGGGEINLLVATSVIEEGVDVPKCNLVAMFDPPMAYRQYVQTKGRARAQKSKYVMFVSRQKSEMFEGSLKNFRQVELLLRKTCRGRAEPTPAEISAHMESVADPLPPYMPLKEDGAARVTMSSAIGLVNRYCARLPSDRYTKLVAVCTVKTMQSEDGVRFVAKLRLPVNSSIRTPIEGSPMATARWAKMAVALEACKLLHQNGELDDHLLPLGKDLIKHVDIEQDLEKEEEDLLDAYQKPGSSKRKQYYTKKIADVYADIPVVAGQPCHLYVFELRLFKALGDDAGDSDRDPFIAHEHPRTLGIITTHAMPQVPVFSVFTRSGEETVSILNMGCVMLTDQQLASALEFHQFVFRSVLRLEKGLMFDPSNSSYSVVVVPTVRDSTVAGGYAIDWTFVHDLRQRVLLIENKPPVTSRTRQQSRAAQPTPLSAGMLAGSDTFDFKKELYTDAVVMPSYRNQGPPDFFYVAKIRTDLTPLSPFPTPQYESFVSYYCSKYGLDISNSAQSLLDVDRTSGRLNLVTPRHVNQKGLLLTTSLPGQGKRGGAHESVHRQHQLLVPELCDTHPCPASLWRKLVCLPSILYRLNTLLLCEELRSRVAMEAAVGAAPLPRGFTFPRLDFAAALANGNDAVTDAEPSPTSNAGRQDDSSAACSSSGDQIDVSLDWDELIGGGGESSASLFVGPSPGLLLHALTMSNANDFVNLERLETVGDSFLKFAITVFLFCSQPGAHEGRLSYSRSKQVSNFNLYRLGKKKGIGNYVISTKFDPAENWLPPSYLPDCGSSATSVDPSAVSGDTSGSSEGGPSRKTTNPAVFTAPYNLKTQHSLSDKSIADCVEALIGCYLTTGGPHAARIFMTWLGLKVLPMRELQQQQTETPSEGATKHQIAPSATAAWLPGLLVSRSPLMEDVADCQNILRHYLSGFDAFERAIDYKFTDRAYLLQAFTHASFTYNTVTDCYQRLEFLGDAVLDYVITRHMFEDDAGRGPGELTDLRSALVNNNVFAVLAVKWNYHKYLKHISSELFEAMRKFVDHQKERGDEINIDQLLSAKRDGANGLTTEEPCTSAEEVEIPKVLGDIFESVAGAIYLDSGMSLDAVWRVYRVLMQDLLKMVATHVPMSPVRELLEMEPDTAKFMKPEYTTDGKVRVSVNIVNKGVFSGVGRSYKNAKVACAKIALHALKARPADISLLAEDE